MKKQYKRYLSMLISLCMLFTLIPTTAFASTTMTNVPNQQVQYGIALGEDQDTISETGLVDVTISLKGTPYINAEEPTDIILMIDKSGSMGSDIAAMSKAAEIFVNQIDLSVHRIGLIIYDDSVADDCKVALTTDKDVLIDKIEQIPTMNQGGTYISVGIEQAMKLLENKRSDASGAIVLMTDGVSNNGYDPDLIAAGKAKALGYSFYTVALCKNGNEAANENLKKMATSEADHYSVFETSKLNSVYSNIASKIGDVNAKDVVITQEINGQFDLVAGSTDNNIPQPTINGNSLVWKMTQLVKGDVTLSYQMKPKASIIEGTYNHAVGYVFYTDYNGDRQKMEIPMQTIEVSHNGPIITSITPDRVDYAGGETVTITGEYFRPGAQILFDGISIPYTYVSANKLQFVAPAHDVDDTVRVMIKNPNGKVAYKNIVVYAENQLASVTPNTVKENTRQQVTIKGSGFNGNYKTADVYFGDVEASIRKITTDTITCTAPALPAGVYEVTVVNADNSISKLAAAYTSEGVVTVVDPCTITSVTPNVAEENTSQKITITGTKFNGNYKTLDVMIGTTEATVSKVDVDNGTIVCTVPKLSVGVYDITVINADDTTGTLVGGYTVNAKVIEPCTITSITPNSVDEDTAQNVTIKGTKFNGTYKTAEVYFGTEKASIASVSETQIVCKAPALAKGVYNVTVINADNTTATLANAYTVNEVVEPTSTITRVNPTSVAANTTAYVEIYGTEFNGNYKTIDVYIGTNKATTSKVDLTNGMIKCRIPKLAAGVYDVTVVNADDTTATLAGALVVT